MSRRTKDLEEARKTGPEAAQRLRALFEKWEREEAEGLYDDEPSWDEFKEYLNEGRILDDKPSPE